MAMSGPMRGLSFLRDCLEDLAGLIEAANIGRIYFPKVPVTNMVPFLKVLGWKKNYESII